MVAVLYYLCYCSYTQAWTNFTMKSCAESLALMCAIMHGPYLKRTQLLCMIWRYCLWAVCPCLSWSAVAFSISIGVEVDSERFHKSFITCENLKCTYPFVQFKFSVYGHTQASIHTHAFCNTCSHASVGLAQARPNNKTTFTGMALEEHCVTYPSSSESLLSDVSGSFITRSINLWIGY